jgi:hypothetical protein
MAEIVLDQAGIGSTVGQVVPASVPEHMRMDRKRVEPRSLGGQTCTLLRV